MSIVRLPIRQPPKQRKLEVDLIYVARMERGEPVAHGLEYLHLLRDERFVAQDPTIATGSKALTYYRKLPEAIQAFESELGERKFDLYVSPPSRRTDAGPYLAAAKRRVAHPVDVSRFFHKVRDIRVGSLKDPLEAITVFGFTYPGSLKKCKSVLIVDDVFASGASVGAIVFWLRERELPKSAEVSVAVPLYSDPPPPTKKKSPLDMLL